MSGLEYRTIRSKSNGNRDGLDDVELRQLKLAFASLDGFAASVEAKCDLVMETTNVVADILRGVVAKVHGIDVRPTSELGPHDEVDLQHSLGVLGRLIEEAQHSASPPETPRVSTAASIDVDRRHIGIETRIANLADGANERVVSPRATTESIHRANSDELMSDSRDAGPIWPGRLTTVELVRASS